MDLHKLQNMKEISVIPSEDDFEEDIIQRKEKTMIDKIRNTEVDGLYTEYRPNKNQKKTFFQPENSDILEDIENESITPLDDNDLSDYEINEEVLQPKKKKMKLTLNERKATVARCLTDELQSDAEKFRKNYENIEKLKSKDIQHYESVLKHNHMGKQVTNAIVNLVNSTGFVDATPSSSTIYWGDYAIDEYFHEMNTSSFGKYGISMVSDIVGGLDIDKLSERITKTIGFIQRLRTRYQQRREREEKDESDDEFESINQQKPLQPNL